MAREIGRRVVTLVVKNLPGPSLTRWIVDGYHSDHGPIGLANSAIWLGNITVVWLGALVDVFGR